LDDLLSSSETIETFTLPFGECGRSLESTKEVKTLDATGELETINPKCWMSKQGAAAVGAAAENSWITGCLLFAHRVTMGSMD